MLVYIPTRGRIGKTRQTALRHLLAYSSYKPILVCPPEEAKLHKAYYPRVRSCLVGYIGPVRQWILENSTADIVVMIDDDLTFYSRPEPLGTTLKACKALDPMFEMVRLCVDRGFIHGGVSNKTHNGTRNTSSPRNGFEERGYVYMDSYRANSFLYLDREKVLDTGARLDEMKIMEDFHFSLGLISRGIQNRVIFQYAWEQQNRDSSGGCSIYRTPELQEAVAWDLHDAYPDFVRVLTKKITVGAKAWGGLKEKVDVKIKWNKAYRKWLLKNGNGSTLSTINGQSKWRSKDEEDID